MGKTGIDIKMFDFIMIYVLVLKKTHVLFVLQLGGLSADKKMVMILPVMKIKINYREELLILHEFILLEISTKLMEMNEEDTHGFRQQT